MTGIYSKALKKGATVTLLTLLLSSATQPLLAQGNQDRSLNSKVIYTDELEKLGVSTIQEALNLVKSISSKQKNTKPAKSEVVYKGVELTGEKQVELNDTLSGLSLEDLDKIEISPDGEKVKYHLSKSLTKDGIKALFSFTVVDLSDIPSKLDPEVITATKTPVKVSELGDVVRVIHADELELMGVTTIEEAIALVSNVQLKNSGGIKSISSRGLKNGNMVVLYDGVNLRDGADSEGAPNFTYIPVSDLDRIEIISGSSSIFHGSNAIGGVVNIISKSRKDKSYISTKFGGGQQYNTLKTNFNLIETDFYVAANSAKDNSLSILPDTTEKDLFSKQAMTVGFKDREVLGGNLSGQAIIIDAHQEVDGYSKDDVDKVTKINQKLYSLNYVTQLINNITTNVDFSHTVLERGYQDTFRDVKDKTLPTSNILYDNSDSDYKSKLYSLGILNNIELYSNNYISFGGEYNYERAEKAGLSGGEYGSDETGPSKKLEDISAVLQYRGKNPIFSSQMGARHLTYMSDGENKKVATVYSVALFRTIPVVDVILKGAWKTGYKLPSYYQKYNQARDALGNENLNSEESETRELSVAKYFGKAHIETAYFETDLKNLITYECIAKNSVGRCTDGLYNNKDKGSTKGMEYSLAIQKIGLLDFLRLGYTNVVSSYQAISTPKFQFTLAVGLKQGRFSYGFFFKRAGHRSDYITPNLWERYYPGYEYADFSIHYDVNKTTKIYTKIHNVSDHNYIVVKNNQTPGRTFFFGLKKTF